MTDYGHQVMTGHQAMSVTTIFFFRAYRKGYLHDSRRENDQKNSYLNIDFENGNCVIKRWFNTRVSHDLSSWLKSWLSHEIKSWGTLSWPTVMTGHDQRHKSWLILTERAKTFKLVTIRHDRSWRRDQGWSWPLVMTKLVTWDLCLVTFFWPLLIHTYSDNTIFNGKLKHKTLLHTDSKEATRGRNL